MSDPFPESLQPECLMAHMRVLCQEIGPRPSTSAQERRAAEYVEQRLRQSGYVNIRRQPFKSQDSFGWVLIPANVAGALAMPIARLGGGSGASWSAACFCSAALSSRERPC